MSNSVAVVGGEADKNVCPTPVARETSDLNSNGQTKPPSSNPSFLGHAKLIGGLTLVSRFMGLAREIVAGHYMGAQLVASAFSVAFLVPNLFRKLFGEGALSAAFIPLYSQALKEQTKEEANAFAAAAVNLLCIALLVL